MLFDHIILLRGVVVDFVRVPFGVSNAVGVLGEKHVWFLLPTGESMLGGLGEHAEGEFCETGVRAFVASTFLRRDRKGLDLLRF